MEVAYRWAAGLVGLVGLTACQTPLDNATAPPLEAHGNEPGWTLTITEGRLELVSDYGKTQRAGPVTSVTASPEGRRYRADDADVTVTVRDAVCADDATGMPHPVTVRVAVGGDAGTGDLRGCGGDPAALLIGDWIVTAVDGATITTDGAPRITVTADGRLSGTSGCNRFSGSYVLTGEGLTIGSLAATKMACPGPVMEQEQRVFEALRAVRRFARPDDATLTLLGPRGARVVTARRADAA